MKAGFVDRVMDHIATATRDLYTFSLRAEVSTSGSEAQEEPFRRCQNPAGYRRKTHVRLETTVAKSLFSVGRCQEGVLIALRSEPGSEGYR